MSQSFFGLKGIILKEIVPKFAFFFKFHSINSPSHLNPLVLMLNYSSIQPSYETHGFGHYLSCYYFSHEGKMWAKVTPA